MTKIEDMLGTLESGWTEVTITTSIKINSDLVRNGLCLAFEGGSNYWYAALDKGRRATEAIQSSEEWSWVYALPTCGGSVTLTDSESDPEQDVYTLDGQAIRRGLDVMADKYQRHFQDFINEDGDADTGDVFLQCCLFGEIVYG